MRVRKVTKATTLLKGMLLASALIILSRPVTGMSASITAANPFIDNELKKIKFIASVTLPGQSFTKGQRELSKKAFKGGVDTAGNYTLLYDTYTAVGHINNTFITSGGISSAFSRILSIDLEKGLVDIKKEGGLTDVPINDGNEHTVTFVYDNYQTVLASYTFFSPKIKFEIVKKGENENYILGDHIKFKLDVSEPKGTEKYTKYKYELYFDNDPYKLGVQEGEVTKFGESDILTWNGKFKVDSKDYPIIKRFVLKEGDEPYEKRDKYNPYKLHCNVFYLKDNGAQSESHESNSDYLKIYNTKPSDNCDLQQKASEVDPQNLGEIMTQSFKGRCQDIDYADWSIDNLASDEKSVYEKWLDTANHMVLYFFRDENETDRTKYALKWPLNGWKSGESVYFDIPTSSFNPKDKKLFARYFDEDKVSMGYSKAFPITIDIKPHTRTLFAVSNEVSPILYTINTSLGNATPRMFFPELQKFSGITCECKDPKDPNLWITDMSGDNHLYKLPLKTYAKDSVSVGIQGYSLINPKISNISAIAWNPIPEGTDKDLYMLQIQNEDLPGGSTLLYSFNVPAPDKKEIDPGDSKNTTVKNLTGLTFAPEYNEDGELVKNHLFAISNDTTSVLYEIDKDSGKATETGVKCPASFYGLGFDQTYLVAMTTFEPSMLYFCKNPFEKGGKEREFKMNTIDVNHVMTMDTGANHLSGIAFYKNA